MASRDELYVLFENEEYRKGKSNVLGGQADLLKVLKALQNLKTLGNQKAKLKKEMKVLLESVAFDIEVIRSNMPVPKVPRKVQHGEIHEEVKEKKKVDYGRMDNLDSELRSINEKLRELNS